MFWLEAKLVVCWGQKWGNACQDVVFIQLGDDSCMGNRPIVPSMIVARETGLWFPFHGERKQCPIVIVLLCSFGLNFIWCLPEVYRSRSGLQP